MKKNYQFLASWFYKTRERIKNGEVNYDNFSKNTEEILEAL